MCHPVIGWACFTRAGLETVAPWFIWSFSKGQKVHHALIMLGLFYKDRECVYHDMLGLFHTTRTGSVSYNDMVGMFYRDRNASYNDSLGLFYRDRKCALQ